MEGNGFISCDFRKVKITWTWLFCRKENIIEILPLPLSWGPLSPGTATGSSLMVYSSSNLFFSSFCFWDWKLRDWSLCSLPPRLICEVRIQITTSLNTISSALDSSRSGIVFIPPCTCKTCLSPKPKDQVRHCASEYWYWVKLTKSTDKII